MFFTSGTTGYPKIALHNHKYPLGHFVTAKYWHNVNPDGIHFTISDTGCGISSEDLPNVKKKFYKANLQVRGSGIGLAVVDEIIKLHNGVFEINSIVDVGTTVTIILPIEKVQIEQPPSLIEEAKVIENE